MASLPGWFPRMALPMPRRKDLLRGAFVIVGVLTVFILVSFLFYPSLNRSAPAAEARSYVPQTEDVLPPPNATGSTEGEDIQQTLGNDRVRGAAVPKDCDLFHGKWIQVPAVPLYNNATCSYISEHQDCHGNGRPDRDYEGWRWQPSGCSLPLFDAHDFFRIMRGKSIVFIGDSLARNQLESLLCLLSQVEVPISKGSKLIHRYSFPRHEVMVSRMWSAWLVHDEDPDDPDMPKDFRKLHLDKTDSRWLKRINDFDVVLLCSGHWWVKPAAYLVGGKTVGYFFWKPKRELENPISNVEGFRTAMETVFKDVVEQHKGITIFRTYSPDHYAGGEWNTGGSCAERKTILKDTERTPNPFGEAILQHQLEVYRKASSDSTAINRSRIMLMDIAPSAGLRADAHPGTFRSRKVQVVVAGKKPPQDCLHWCLPGAIDTWNEFLLQMLTWAFS